MIVEINLLSFSNQFNISGNHSKALSEETCRKIEDDEYNKLLACCDTQEISSMMADLRDSAPQKLRYLKAKGKSQFILNFNRTINF